MGKAEHKVKGGKLLKVQLTTKEDMIEQIKITGDFFLHPEELIDQLETAIEQQPLNEQFLTTLITTVLEQNEGTLLGASPEDFARCILKASEKDG